MWAATPAKSDSGRDGWRVRSLGKILSPPAVSPTVYLQCIDGKLGLRQNAHGQGTNTAAHQKSKKVAKGICDGRLKIPLGGVNHYGCNRKQVAPPFREEPFYEEAWDGRLFRVLLYENIAIFV